MEVRAVVVVEFTPTRRGLVVPGCVRVSGGGCSEGRFWGKLDAVRRVSCSAGYNYGPVLKCSTRNRELVRSNPPTVCWSSGCLTNKSTWRRTPGEDVTALGSLRGTRT